MAWLRFGRVDGPHGPLWVAETDAGIAAASHLEAVEPPWMRNVDPALLPSSTNSRQAGAMRGAPGSSGHVTLARARGAGIRTVRHASDRVVPAWWESECLAPAGTAQRPRRGNSDGSHQSARGLSRRDPR